MGGFDFTVEVLDLAGHGAGVRLVFEKSGECLFALGDVLEVLFGFAFFLFEVADGGFAAVAFLDCVDDGSEVEEFAFGPVVNIDVGVLELASYFV